MSKNAVLLYYGLLSLSFAIFFGVLVKINPNPILGVSGWIKPVKFCLSITIIAWTMGYYMQFLENQVQVRLYSWSLIVLLSIEIILISYQASQGKISHFNQEDYRGKIIFGTMAFAISLFIVHTAYISLLFFSQTTFRANQTTILAIKLSLLITLLFACEGFIMGAILKHTIGNPDGSKGLPIVNWSQQYGDLRVAHFFGIHALQCIPILNYYLAKTKNHTYIIAICYFLFVSLTLVQALNAKPFIKL